MNRRCRERFAVKRKREILQNLRNPRPSKIRLSPRELDRKRGRRKRERDLDGKGRGEGCSGRTKKWQRKERGERCSGWA